MKKVGDDLITARQAVAIILALLAFVDPAIAQTNPQRIPPENPILQFAGRMPNGDATFVEAATFGRWQDRGFGWLLVMAPSDPQPIWIREIVDCRTHVITDDYIVWVDGKNLMPFASSDAGFPFSKQSHAPEGRVESTFAAAACSGAPLDIGQRVGDLQAAITFARRLP